MTKIRVKEWFYDKMSDEAKRVNCYIDFERTGDEINGRKVVDGYMTVYVDEEIAETEKAICLRLQTGSVVGNMLGYKTWIPKSVTAQA